MYKVFIIDKTIFLIKNINNYKIKPNDLIYRYNPNMSLSKIVKQFEMSNSENLFIYNNNAKELLNVFFKTFKLIDAAGGLVKNSENKILFIFRLEKWDLPKGKIEKYEIPEKTAIREVKEECGISDLKIIKKLPCTYHIYNLKEEKIIKRTYWFEMYCQKNESPVPQTIEDITMAKWLNKKQVTEALRNTYKSINELVDFYYNS